MDDDSLDSEYSELNYPEDIDSEEAISKLDHYSNAAIGTFMYDVDDEHWDTSQNLRDALLSNQEFSDTPVSSVKICNYCHEEQKRNECFDYFLRFVGIRNNYNCTHQVDYVQHDYPLEMTQAEQFASAFEPIPSGVGCRLSLTGDILFQTRGTFECFFNAVIDSGKIIELNLLLDSITDLKLGCIGRSNLANNTTLETLWLDSLDEDALFVVDDAMIQLADALRRNVGLTEIYIRHNWMTTIGRTALLECLRDNTTIVSLETLVLNRNEKNYNITADDEKNRLQSRIDHQTKLNRFWKRLQQYPYRKSNEECKSKEGDGDDDDDDDDNDDADDADDADDDDDNSLNSDAKQRRKKKPLSLKIYPDVLEVLAHKPLLLFKFLRDDVNHVELLNSGPIASPGRKQLPPQQHDRVSKKRRLQSPASAYAAPPMCWVFSSIDGY